MTDPKQFDQVIRRRLADYSRDAAGDVRAPGAEDVFWTVKHRQQRRTTVLTIACIAVVVLLLGAIVQMRRNPTVPVTVPPSASPSASASPSLSPSPSASPSPSPSLSPSPSPSKTSSSPPPPPEGPARRTFPIVDGSELHVVALDRVTLQPEGDHYVGIVNVDVYNSGRQTNEYTRVYLTRPPGVQYQASGGVNPIGCVIPDPPETDICGGNAVPAAGGYARTVFYLTVNIAPGSKTQTIPGFAVRFVAMGQQNTVLTDVTPADNKAVVTLVLPPG